MVNQATEQVALQFEISKQISSVLKNEKKILIGFSNVGCLG
jgi:hypothetical protein